MIVCVCRAISDRAVRAARAAGARTVEAIAAATGAGTLCGCCRDEMARIIAQPCKADPCPGCPRAATGAVPQRIAAGSLQAP